VFGLDTAGRITVAGGNFDGSVLGNTGGAQNQTLTAGQLPVITPTFTGTQQTWTSNQSNVDFGVTNQAGGGGAGPTVNSSGSITVTVTPAGTISSFGGGASHPIVPPAIVLPYILRII
jgi:microcystin-dependent protein